MVVIKIILIVLAILLLGIIILGFVRTRKTQSSKNQEAFLAGTLPSPAPDGEYNGTITDYKGSWRGKEFTSSQSRGINRFEDEPGVFNKRHPFKTETGVGIRDKQTQVFKIDYNISGNAFWAKPVLDEIVQVGDNEYLGKIHYRLIPGMPFSIGYFRLKK
jgi:hypothetical protein